jgi:hypothetical protein
MLLDVNLIPSKQVQTSDTTVLTPVPENVLRYLVTFHSVWTSTNQPTNTLTKELRAQNFHYETNTRNVKMIPCEL